MAESIVWDGSNICAVDIFVSQRVKEGSSYLHYEEGFVIVQYGAKLPVAIGDAIVATDSGVTVEKGVV